MIEPLQTPEQLQWSSNLAHWIEGGMFGIVAVIALLQALAYAKSKAAQYLWPGLVLIAGLFLPYTYYYSADLEKLVLLEPKGNYKQSKLERDEKWSADLESIANEQPLYGV